MKRVRDGLCIAAIIVVSIPLFFLVAAVMAITKTDIE